MSEVPLYHDRSTVEGQQVSHLPARGGVAPGKQGARRLQTVGARGWVRDIIYIYIYIYIHIHIQIYNNGVRGQPDVTRHASRLFCIRARPFVGVSRPRSWSRFLVLGAILWEIVVKS